MDNDRLDMLRRIFKITSFGAFFLIFGFLAAAQLGLVDAIAFVQTTLFWFATGVIYFVIILWGIFAFWLELKDPYNTTWLESYFWQFLAWVTLKIRGKRR